MATRPAWKYDNAKRKIVQENFSFDFNPGFSKVQKQRNIIALHEKIGKKTLEISTKSFDNLGIKLSAFNLKLDGHLLECVFQSSKQFELGGPFTDLLNVHPKNAKRDERLKNSGKLISFIYKGVSFPITPKTIFYDYIYINAVKQCISNGEIQQILEFEYFTDIEFIPTKSINCQARSIAMIKAMLIEFGQIPDVSNFNEFTKFWHFINN